MFTIADLAGNEKLGDERDEKASIGQAIRDDLSLLKTAFHKFQKKQDISVFREREREKVQQNDTIEPAENPGNIRNVI